MTTPDEQRPIAEMHVHYAMHLLAEKEPAPGHRKLCGLPMSRMDRLRAFLVRQAARRLNVGGLSATWRVDFDGLAAARAGLVLSVLFDPASEILVWPYRQRPRRASFSALICQLECVEADLEPRTAAVLVRSVADLDAARDEGKMAIAHCVEGGFHLGPHENLVDMHVAELARRGVVYITLAHLFPRGVAACAPAMPPLPDPVYDLIFGHGGREGLTNLGRAAIRAMYRHGVLVDVSHMRADALTQTFELLDDLDERSGRDPTSFPVLATHAGYRFGKQRYMLDEGTIEQIRRRNGVIGLILARHQLQDGRCDGDGIGHTIETLRRHLEKIHDITRSWDHVCIGSDLDGFIKPMSAIERAGDLAELATKLREAFPPDVAEALLVGNADRVVRQAFALRE